jgi:tRNA nucleotidyltransferase (CCA-adding enzyme)
MARPLPQPARVYQVGGAVRDELLGRTNADRDFVVVGVTPETMLASGFRPVGRDFPVFLHPDTQEEYALARTERKHGRGYRGFEFFASPDVTLEEDLARRDLTINAMARGEDGVLVDPHGGQADLRAGVLRHVSPAFVEDPLRVLRAARFAARLGFAVAPETEALMRAIVASGELSTLAPERIWQELAKGLMEARPSRMLGVLRECGALAQLLPEVDAAFGVPVLEAAQGEAAPGAHDLSVHDLGVHLVRSLDWAASRGHTLSARYGVLAHNLGPAAVPRDAWPAQASAAQNVRLAESVSERLKVPLTSRDAARLAARWRPTVQKAAELRPAQLLDLLHATDGLRRPGRLGTLLEVCTADACRVPVQQDEVDFAPARLLREAHAVARSVNGRDRAQDGPGKREEGRRCHRGGRARGAAKALRAGASPAPNTKLIRNRFHDARGDASFARRERKLERAGLLRHRTVPRFVVAHRRHDGAALRVGIRQLVHVAGQMFLDLAFSLDDETQVDPVAGQSRHHTDRK